MATSVDTELRTAFSRQVQTLLHKGYPELAGLDEDAFVARLAPLEKRLSELPSRSFVIVPGSGLIPADAAIARVELHGKDGFTSMAADDLARFAPLDDLDVPAGPAYLVADLDTGAATLNLTPDDALATIVRERRSPLTIDEGLALVTHRPEVLDTENAFSLLGSRCGDRRVAAIWISGGRPRLGWCWAGNPHTWLGSASCAARIGAPPAGGTG
jgi:hypothetical protein